MPIVAQSTRRDDAPAEPTHTVFVVPRGEGNGFQASVRGHILDLVDPSSYALAPTTDDLFAVSVAAALAWSARAFLRSLELPDYVSVSAEWRVVEDGPIETNLTIALSPTAEGARAELAAAFEQSIAERFRARPVVHISFEGS